jgi:hypothetical protein
MRSTIFLLACLMLMLACVLGNRRISWRQLDWWAIQSIAFCLFLTGRFL